MWILLPWHQPLTYIYEDGVNFAKSTSESYLLNNLVILSNVSRTCYSVIYLNIQNAIRSEEKRFDKRFRLFSHIFTFVLNVCRCTANIRRRNLSYIKSGCSYIVYIYSYIQACWYFYEEEITNNFQFLDGITALNEQCIFSARLCNERFITK